MYSGESEGAVLGGFPTSMTPSTSTHEVPFPSVGFMHHLRGRFKMKVRSCLLAGFLTVKTFLALLAGAGASPAHAQPGPYIGPNADQRYATTFTTREKVVGTIFFDWFDETVKYADPQFGRLYRPQ